LSAPPQAPPPAPAPRRRPRWGWLILAAVLLASLGGLARLPYSETGSQWLLRGAQTLLPALTVQQPQGALLDEFSAQRLVWRLNAQQTLVIEQLRWQGLRLERGDFWGLHLSRLQARRVAVEGVSTRADPLVLPTQLTLPMGVVVDTVQIDQLDTAAIQTQPVRDLRLALRLGAGPLARHEARDLSLRWERLRAQGQLSIGAAAPLLLKAQLKLQQEGASAADTRQLPQAWQAQLQAQGALARFKVQGRLRARAQSLDAEALLRPAHPMPLETLEARMAGLDLADLSSRWPRTALGGLVQAQLGDTLPISLQLQAQLSNAAAGRADQGGLPIRSLRLQAHSAAQDPGQGQLQQLQLELGDARRKAGVLQAQGQWRIEGSGASRALALQLQTQLQDLQPALLDERAPPIQLSGPASLQWRQPWPADAASNTPLGGGRVQADWRGHSLRPAPSGTTPAVRLQLDAQGTAERIELARFEASTGAAQWLASGLAEHQNAAWALQLQSTLKAFDPALWLGHTVGLPPSRLDAQLNAQLRWADAPQPWPARLQGQADLQLQPSLLAGVPARGHAQLHSQNGLRVDSQLQLGTATASTATPLTLTLQGQLDPSAQAQDHWDLRWTGTELAVLNPWLQPLGGHPELSGQSLGQLQLNGRWPHLASQGELQAGLLRWRTDTTASPSAPSAALDAARVTDQVVAAAQQAVGAKPTAPTANAASATPARRSLTELQDLQLRWALGSQGADPFSLDARLAQARSGSWRLLASTLNGSGRMDQHSLRLQSTALPIGPNTGPNTAPPTATGNGGAADLNGQLPWALQAAAEGAWVLGQPITALGNTPSWGWQGRLQSLQASRSATQRQAALVLRSEPAALSLLHNAQASSAELGPTRLLWGQAVLAVQSLQWQRNAQGPSLALQARLEPSLLAPLLEQAQPGFGWRGDLKLAGSAQIQASPGRFQAQLQLARDSGDLGVEDPDLGSGVQSLGLNELAFQLQALDGHWRFTERVGGARMGHLRGDFSATTEPAVWLPGPSTPVRGQLDLDTPQLGFWGAWLPSGWRLAGQLAASAQVSGTLGQPRLQGQVQGQHIAVRNLLQGVDWHDAQLQAKLNGDTLLLERFTLQAGTGSLSATGRASLGGSPILTLQAQADHFAALQRIDRRVVASGQAELLIDASRLKLSGQLQADEGRIDFSRSDAPSLADDVEVQRAGDTSSLPLGQRKASSRSLQLDLRATLGNHFQLVGRGLNTHLRGDLRLTSPGNKAQLQGVIRAEDGTYAAYGQKLAIERGLISFSGPIENPRLDVQAVRSDLDDVKVGVAITGTAQAPRVRLYSDPEMSDTDKLSWLLMGRASDGLGRTDLALLQRAAYALLSGESEGPSLIQRFGIDSLSVSQSEGTVQETVVSLGKQLSRRWYLGYERSLQATTGTWLLTYKLAQRFTVRAQSGADNALDFIWSWKWGQGE